MAQLLTEGIRRILLIVPKPLIGQWQTELFSLFGIETRLGRFDPEAFAGDGVFLIHREFAGGSRGSSLLRAADPFDLAVIDEAHEVFAGIYRRFDQDGEYKDDSEQAQTADRVRSLLRAAETRVLLLTATPIQNSLAELWGLVQYVEPTGLLLGKLPIFREVFCESKDRGVIPEQAFELRRRLGQVLQRTLRRQAQEFLEIPFVERQAKLVEYSMRPEEKSLYADVTAWLMSPNLCAFRGGSRRLLLIAFLRRLASSLRALTSSLEKVAERLWRAYTKGGGVKSDDLAAEFAADLEEDLEELEEAPAETAEGQGEKADEPPALERLRAEAELVESFIGRAKAIRREAKAECLLNALEVIRERGAAGAGTGKCIIFTESIQTQDFLHELLTENGYASHEVTLFRGRNDSAPARAALERWRDEVGRALPADKQPGADVATRLALVHEFKERSRVFISTEAGGKGLNLQFCETLVNYDLPWNPQRIEQRIGRVHRYRQTRGVTVLNFVDRGNEAQAITFEILSQKLDLFGKVLDGSDAVLHTPSAEFPESVVSALGVDFEMKLRSIYAQARSLEEITDQLRGLRDEMASKRQEFDAEQARAVELIKTRFDDSVRRIFLGYKESLSSGLKELDQDIDCLVAGFLQARGVPFSRVESSGKIVYRIEPSALLPDGLQAGGVFLSAHAAELSEGDPLHPGHALVRAAIDEARQATSRALVVELSRGPADLPDCLAPHAGKRGRLIITKVAYRGLEAVDSLLVTAMIEGGVAPLEGLSIKTLMSLGMRDLTAVERSVVFDDAAVEDAVDEAVLADQRGTTARDEDRFNRRLEQLDRYLDDQALVLRRRRAGLERKLAEAEARKQNAKTPSLLGVEDKAIRSFEREIAALSERIERVAQGDDPAYQQWRARLFERRYQRPAVQRLLDVAFRIAVENEGSQEVASGGGAC